MVMLYSNTEVFLNRCLDIVLARSSKEDRLDRQGTYDKVDRLPGDVKQQIMDRDYSGLRREEVAKEFDVTVAVVKAICQQCKKCPVVKLKSGRVMKKSINADRGSHSRKGRYE